MRHDARALVNKATNPATELARYLSSTGSTLSVARATEQAVLAWIAADRAARSTRDAAIHARGAVLAHDDSASSRADANEAAYAPAGIAPAGIAPVGIAPVGIAPVGIAPVGIALAGNALAGNALAGNPDADRCDAGAFQEEHALHRAGAAHESNIESRGEGRCKTNGDSSRDISRDISRDSYRDRSRDRSHENRSVGESPPPVKPPPRGYRWKLLFLPEGTRLRMDSDGRAHYACVEEDQIIFRAVSVSPRGMTLAVAGNGRNAWSELSLCFPGERIWVRAGRCRADLRRALLPDEPRPHGKAAGEALRGLCMIGTALRGPGMQPPRATPRNPALDIDPRAHLHDDLHAVMRAEKRADMPVEGGRFEPRRFGWPQQTARDDVASGSGCSLAGASPGPGPDPDFAPDFAPDPDIERKAAARVTLPSQAQLAMTKAQDSWIERRIPKHRREADFLEDWCAFD